MAIYFPKAVTIDRFQGGYQAASDFTDLGPTDTADAANVLYDPSADIRQRGGSQKILNTRLTNSSATAGAQIIGHTYFKKLGTTTGFHVVAAADSIYNVTSAVASAILTGQNSASFYTFAQMQDPRSASDDFVVMSNGVNSMSFWNGSASALLLSSLTSATQVPVAKYITHFKNRIYAANIVDSTDVDSPVKVSVSSFGTDGAPDPHRFLNFFYCGGSDKDGEIQGVRPINDQLAIYTRKGIWKYTPGAGTNLSTSSLQKVKDNLGLLAPKSLVDAGEFHIFLSERGVFAFDGIQAIHLSEKVDTELLDGSNPAHVANAVGAFNFNKNQYILYYPSTASTKNDRALVYDLRLKVWQPPVTGRNVSVISNYETTDDITKVTYGDYSGYLYEDDVGTVDGGTTGYNGTVTSGGASSLTDSSAAFDTANDGISGMFVRIYEGTGSGQTKEIVSNTSAVLTLDSAWNIVPDTTSKYTIGGIDGFWRSKDYELTSHDIVKIWRHLRLRLKDSGDNSLTVHLIIDFNSLSRATSTDVSQFAGGFIWGTSKWNESSWGSRGTVRRKISIRSTPTQSNLGAHMAVRFSNTLAGQSFRVSGFDIEAKELGRR